MATSTITSWCFSQGMATARSAYQCPVARWARGGFWSAFFFSVFLGFIASCSDDPATGSQADLSNDPSAQDLRERDIGDQGGDAQDLDFLGEPDADAIEDPVEAGDIVLDSQADADPDLLGDAPDGPDEQDGIDSTDGTGDDLDQEVLDCPDDQPAYVGVHVLDFNEAPLRVNDPVLITMKVIGLSASGEPGWLWADIINLDILEGTVLRNDLPLSTFTLVGERLEIPLENWETATYTVEGSVVDDWQLVAVRAGLAVGERDCSVARSRSGALLQVIGGASKTPFCLDMAEFRSVQVAPRIPLQNTSAYREQNGQREDLMADEFIFCPQNPTIVHETEFCLTRQAGQSITLAGHYEATGTWEVDDFALVEVLEGGGLLGDGCTTQTHPGGDTFWCPDPAGHLCETGCQAELTVIEGGRVIEPIGVASAVGECPRCFDDGEVLLDGMLPSDGHAVDVRVTALDMGIEGELQPALYILSTDPD